MVVASGGSATMACTRWLPARRAWGLRVGRAAMAVQAPRDACLAVGSALHAGPRGTASACLACACLAWRPHCMMLAALLWIADARGMAIPATMQKSVLACTLDHCQRGTLPSPLSAPLACHLHA